MKSIVRVHLSYNNIIFDRLYHEKIRTKRIGPKTKYEERSSGVQLLKRIVALFFNPGILSMNKSSELVHLGRFH